MTSNHYTNDRIAREAIIKEIGYGEIVKKAIVDKGHRNGPERHEITSTGIIVIYNARTNKLVTKLIARVGQIKRYYEANNEEAPTELLEIAREHQKMKYNYC